MPTKEHSIGRSSLLAGSNDQIRRYRERPEQIAYRVLNWLGARPSGSDDRLINHKRTDTAVLGEVSFGLRPSAECNGVRTAHNVRAVIPNHVSSQCALQT